MFAAETPRDGVEAFGACMKDFHPAGFRAMARAAEFTRVVRGFLEGHPTD